VLARAHLHLIQRKKVHLEQGHLYVSAGRNSAFTHHHALAESLSERELNRFLQERHSEKDWVTLLHVLNQVSNNTEKDVVGSGSTFNDSVLAYATPGQKRKERYDDTNLPSVDEDSVAIAKRGSMLESLGMEDELVIIPSQDSQELTEEERVTHILSQWELLVNSVNKLAAGYRSLRASIGDDLESLETKLVNVETNLGSALPMLGFDDCISAWDGLALL
jgi:hypothetical protein